MYLPGFGIPSATPLTREIWGVYSSFKRLLTPRATSNLDVNLKDNLTLKTLYDSVNLSYSEKSFCSNL